ncbi:hypothetical protein CR513_09471, partial [Mucuna pruriens]
MKLCAGYSKLGDNYDRYLPRTFHLYLDRFVSWEKHVEYLRVVLQVLKDKWLYTKMSSVTFRLRAPRQHKTHEGELSYYELELVVVVLFLNLERLVDEDRFEVLVIIKVLGTH